MYFGQLALSSCRCILSTEGHFSRVMPLVSVRSGVNVFLRKIAVAAASSPAVEIAQQGDNLSIKTSTSVRTTHVSFTVGQSFSEATVDGRPCTVRILLLFLHTRIQLRPAELQFSTKVAHGNDFSAALKCLWGVFNFFTLKE